MFSTVLVARVLHFCPRAHLALDLAAPVERTAASFAHRVALRLVAPPTTHQVTPVYPYRRRITHASDGTGKPYAVHFVTEIWRILKIDEISLVGSFVVGIRRLQSEFILSPPTSVAVPCKIKHSFTFS